MTKRKQERRELLKEDEFLSMMERWVLYAQKNTRQVLVLVGAIFVALIAFFAYLHYSRVKSEKAAAHLYEAEKILTTQIDDQESDLEFASEAEKNIAALKVLDEIIASESGTPRYQAMVYKLTCLMNLGRNDDVEPLYQELLQGPHPFEELGLQGLGDYYFAAEDYDKALDYFNRLVASATSMGLSDQAKYDMARCYKAKGDLASARVELDALIAKFEGKEPSEVPPIVQQAKQLLAELDAATESEPEPTGA